ncbi:MAG: O-antigen ligase family protein [Acidobacteria bacterium]|nr:O-antigen ligase family protein [Acidobacteriota bacterium]
MKRPPPYVFVGATLFWGGLAAALLPNVLPSHLLYRTVVAAVSVVLFGVACGARRAGLLLAVGAISVAGVSALAFGLPEPAPAGVVLGCAALSGAALRSLYELRDVPATAPFLPLFRAFWAVTAISGVAGFVWLRTSYLLLRGVPPPRAVDALGGDAGPLAASILAIAASAGLAAGFYHAVRRLTRDARGRRAGDAALLVAALVPGLVALLQRLTLLPVLRAERWAAWDRSQATFTDPSAAGVAAGILVAPLLAIAATGSRTRRILAGLAVALVLLVLADAGSRAGLVAGLTSGGLFASWTLTRAVAGAQEGVRRRFAASLGALAVLATLAFAGALAWPANEGERPVLISRISALFEKGGTPGTGAPDRVLLYAAAAEMFRERPFWGVGLGVFRAEFPAQAARLSGTAPGFSDHPPSLYLGVLAESGIAGGLVLALLLAGLLPVLSRALTLPAPGRDPEDPLREAGAASALVGLLVVFLFGAHLVYPEIALLFGLLAARLPEPRDGVSSRLLHAAGPVVAAGAIGLATIGAVTRIVETATPREAFRFAPRAGVHTLERESSGRPFRWSSRHAAFLVAETGPGVLSLPVRNAGPSRETVTLSLFFDDVFRGAVRVPANGFRSIRLGIVGPGVLRVVVEPSFVPEGSGDSRSLGVETQEPTFERKRRE